ncbi:hypothetical protein CpipJ_CPIJ004764 [Culex quinquefasciatus]|uniref:Uncharacterized protein n=1 Tax=Culex quinquefasciatus TaxID=7176 RepID=B0WCE0_CULQU|nr:hypothetical protein CpipJ_CPIJ004764 [Culex quinquefasciatus]|eukprot:XP_001846374.1 hypothetical protein CpipJ_CPIJ004764 [Culex quinquefasciatus]
MFREAFKRIQGLICNHFQGHHRRRFMAGVPDVLALALVLATMLNSLSWSPTSRTLIKR